MTAEQIVEELRTRLTGNNSLLWRLAFMLNPANSARPDVIKLRDEVEVMYKKYDGTYEEKEELFYSTNNKTVKDRPETPVGSKPKGRPKKVKPELSNAVVDAAVENPVMFKEKEQPVTIVTEVKVPENIEVVE
jgi:hypothetical protein